MMPSHESSLAPPSTRRPLRILEVASGLPHWGGTEIHLLALAERLTQRGHQVTVLCQTGSYVEKEAVRRGLPTLHAAVKNQSDISSFGPLMKVMQAREWDVVHVHWAPDYLLPPIAARLAKVPVVLMSHHSPHPLKRKYLRQKIWRGGLFNRIIALSESVRQMLLSNGMPGEKVVTIHHGTDPEGFCHTTLSPEVIRAEWAVPHDAFLVGMAGRLSQEKGIDVFLKAIALLPHLPIRGCIIGDGRDGEEFRELAKKLGIEERIVWAGFRSDVNDAMNALDALVLASTWAEPCAAVVQQAMILQKPVIGTDIGGTPEMVDKDKTGLLVPPGDAVALASAIESLFTLSVAQRQEMGRKGRERVEALFTQSGMVSKIEALYYDELDGLTGVSR